MNYAITIRAPHGAEFTYEEEWPNDSVDGLLYWWGRGNGACDCNRRLHALSSKGVDMMLLGHLTCGTTWDVTRLVVEGEDMTERLRREEER